MWLIVYSNDHAPLTVRPIYSSSKLRTIQMMIFSLVAMIGLEKCCITSACLQWLCHSGERIVARGPLVFFTLFYFIFILFFCKTGYFPSLQSKCRATVPVFRTFKICLIHALINITFCPFNFIEWYFTMMYVYLFLNWSYFFFFFFWWNLIQSNILCHFSPCSLFIYSYEIYNQKWCF